MRIISPERMPVRHERTKAAQTRAEVVEQFKTDRHKKKAPPTAVGKWGIFIGNRAE